MSDTQYWLMKSEPDVFDIDDLKAVDQEPWDSIRNYEARNFMRDDMKVGDKVLFYYSNVRPPRIVGTMEVASESYPDPTQFDPESNYFDKKSSEEDPTWQLVDVKFVQKFDEPVTRDAIKSAESLQDMVLLNRFRLSITPVTKQEWKKIHEMAGADLE